jgi:hypothetical protein
MSSKPPRTHILDPRPDAHAAGIEAMLCGMQSRYERRLIYTTNASLADCSKCLARSKESTHDAGFLALVSRVNASIRAAADRGHPELEQLAHDIERMPRAPKNPPSSPANRSVAPSASPPASSSSSEGTRT